MRDTMGGDTLYDWLGGEEGLEVHRNAVDECILDLLEIDR